MAVPSDVLRAARRRQKLDSVLTTQRPWNVEPRVDGLTRRSCALPRSALLLAIAWRPGKLRLALLVCASGSNVCRSSGVSTGFAEPWHLLRGVCQMYPSYVLLIMRGCIESKQMPSSMKQEGWFKRCAALSAFLVMTAAASAAQVKPGDLSARQEFSHQVVKAAVERTQHVVRYDPAYVRIPYPGGDVPADTGVCTDEIVRIYRSVGIDLQKEMHEDIVANPSIYHLSGPPDWNIDDRRVPNLIICFRRHGLVL